MRPYGNGLEIDAYGSIWKRTQDISELHKPVLHTIDFEDYQFPTMKDFLTEEKWARAQKELADHPDLYPVGNIGAGIYELTWRLLGVEDTLMDMVTDEEKNHCHF